MVHSICQYSLVRKQMHSISSCVFLEGARTNVGSQCREPTTCANVSLVVTGGTHLTAEDAFL